MLSHYFGALVALSASTAVLSAPVKEARNVESHLPPRGFYWQCSPGQYFAGNPPPNSNPGSCTSCQAGTFSSDGVNCYATPKGFYNDVAGAKNPIGCLPGTFTSSTGSIICQACTAPLMSYAAATKCVPCADGSSSSDSSSCTPCASGFFSTNGAACNQCQPGTFFAGVACHTTPAGFYNDKPGAGDPIGCLAGMYSDTTGATACKTCTLPFMSFAAATKCIPCADGSSSSDSIYCKACPSGTFSVNGAACNTCQPGTFFAGGTCHVTPVGFYNDKAGSADPSGCAAGMYSDQTGAIICKACAAPLMSYAAFAKCIACADGLTSNDGQYCVPCPDGTTSKGGSVCSKANPNYSILVTDSNNVNQGYLSNQGEAYGWVQVQDPAEAIQINPPSSFLASDMPINLLSTTLGTKSGYDGHNSVGQPGYGYSLAFSQNGGDHLKCDGGGGNLILTQSTTDNVAEYFNQANDYGGGNKAASKIWVIGAFDPVNNRYPLSLSIYGVPDSKAPPVTSAYIVSYGDQVIADCDPGRYIGQKDLLYLVPAVN